MKKLFALTLSVMTLMLFCACGTVASDKNQPTDTTGSADKNTYMSIIDLLEGEIEQLRRDQQTNTAEYESKIAELESQLEIAKDYASAWGDFFGYTPQELTKEEQMELRNHMKILEKKWQKKMKEENSD